MVTLLAYLFAFFATVPFFSFFIIYGLLRWRKKEKRSALLWSVHMTTVLLFFSVMVMDRLIREENEPNALFWIIGFALLVSILLILLQRKIRGQIHILKVLRAVSIALFFLLSASYVFLFVKGIVHYVRMG